MFDTFTLFMKLGFYIQPEFLAVTVTRDNVNKTQTIFNALLQNEINRTSTLPQVAEVIGILVSISYGPLHYKHLERDT